MRNEAQKCRKEAKIIHVKFRILQFWGIKTQNSESSKELQPGKHT